VNVNAINLAAQTNIKWFTSSVGGTVTYGDDYGTGMGNGFDGETTTLTPDQYGRANYTIYVQIQYDTIVENPPEVFFVKITDMNDVPLAGCNTLTITINDGQSAWNASQQIVVLIDLYTNNDFFSRV
jgi:hypothetical protein